MGQYFKLVNIDKREYLDPHCCGDGAKFIEITTGNMPALLAYLLRQSTGDGGGDIMTVQHRDEIIKHYEEKGDKRALQLAKQYYRGAIDPKYAGRWAGDRITLVGDYDESKLYDEAESFVNIAHDVIEEYNQFVTYDECRVFVNDWHHCEVFRRKEEIKQLYAFMEGAFHDHKDEYQDRIDVLEAEDEYYGWKENWKFQLPKKKVQKKGISAPDMVIRAKGDNEN